MISLVANTIEKEDIDALAEWLKTYPRLTYGDLTKEFEEKFAEYIGSKYAVFVNSGSSANLLATYTAAYLGKKRIGIPALCWSTDVFPAVQFGMDIHFINYSNNNYGLDIDSILDLGRDIDHDYSDSESEEIAGLDCLIAVDVLGLPALNDMDWLKNRCREKEVFLIEDACESLGSTMGEKKLGTFGDIGTFSFYFGHHVSTIEGGMLVTDNFDTYEFLLAIRSHGWGREWSDETRKRSREKFNISEFNEKFTFFYPGFNVRPTEIQSFLGLRQLPKLDWISKKRAWNFDFYERRLINKNVGFPDDLKRPNSTISSFGIPLRHPNRDELIKKLTKNNIESRPLIAGSFIKQPAAQKFNHTYDLCIDNSINEQGLYLPCHQDMGRQEIDFICDIVESTL